MAIGKKLTPEQETELKRLRLDEGLSLGRIAAIMTLSKSTVSTYCSGLRANNLSDHWRYSQPLAAKASATAKNSGIHDAKIAELAANGLGGRLIAQQLGLNVGQVSKRLKRMGLIGDRCNNIMPCVDQLGISFISTGHFGLAAERYLQFLCSVCGYKYAIPDYNEPYDLLVDFGAGWTKIQVKSDSKRTPGVFTLVKTRHNNTSTRIVSYSLAEVDYFFLMTRSLRCWLIPAGLLLKTNHKGVKPAYSYPGFEIKLMTVKPAGSGI